MPRAPFQVLVLPFRRTARGLEVAVFHRTDYALWQFVSGGGEGEETPEAAARREAHEEAGAPLDAEILTLDAMTMIPACWFHEWAEWPPHVRLIPEHAFAIDVGAHPLRISAEHTEFRWCTPLEAMELLRFDSNKNALWELQERLFPGPRIKRPAYR